MPKHFEVCHDVDHVKAGETFEWVNSTDKDCTLTECKPPLEKSSYFVKKHSSLLAKAQDHIPVGNYKYECDCGDTKSNPKIIIGTD